MQVDTAVTLLAIAYIAARMFAPAWFAGSGLGSFVVPAAATFAAAAWRIAEPARCAAALNPAFACMVSHSSPSAHLIRCRLKPVCLTQG